jgi:hypothetical protein
MPITQLASIRSVSIRSDQKVKSIPIHVALVPFKQATAQTARGVVVFDVCLSFIMSETKPGCIGNDYLVAPRKKTYWKMKLKLFTNIT